MPPVTHQEAEARLTALEKDVTETLITLLKVQPSHSVDLDQNWLIQDSDSPDDDMMAYEVILQGEDTLVIGCNRRNPEAQTAPVIYNKQVITCSSSGLWLHILIDALGSFEQMLRSK